MAEYCWIRLQRKLGDESLMRPFDQAVQPLIKKALAAQWQQKHFSFPCGRCCGGIRGAGRFCRFYELILQVNLKFTKMLKGFTFEFENG